MIKLNLIPDRDILLNAPLPEKTNTYTPIPNEFILNLIEEECHKNNLIILNENYKSTLEGDKFIGLFDIQSSNSNIGMRLGFKNSYDKSMSFGLAVGAVVYACTNGMICGEINLKRKHTGNANEIAKEKIRIGIESIQETFERLLQDKNKMDNVAINSKINAELIGRMFLEENIINSIQLNCIKDQLYNSTNFRKITDREYTMWDMYNHITESLKLTHPITFIQKHIDLHNFITPLIN